MRSRPTIKFLPIEHVTLSSERRSDPNKAAPLDRMLKSFGFMTPLIVRKVDDHQFEIIDGERRLVAAERLGLKKVPCVIYTNYSNDDVARVRFYEDGE
jgi:ParB family chromosome partitioning protein